MLKITAGFLKGRKIETPSEATTRPTSEKIRQAVFNSIQNKIENSVFLDLYAGSASMGIEAISRGAKMAVFVEKNKEAASIIQNNLLDLDIDDNSLLIANDIFKAITHLECGVLTFNLIYIDPPYENVQAAEEDIEKLLQLLDKSSILAKSGTLFVEFTAYSKLDFSKMKFKRLQFKSTKAYGRSKLEIFTF